MEPAGVRRAPQESVVVDRTRSRSAGRLGAGRAADAQKLAEARQEAAIPTHLSLGPLGAIGDAGRWKTRRERRWETRGDGRSRAETQCAQMVGAAPDFASDCARLPARDAKTEKAMEDRRKALEAGRSIGWRQATTQWESVES